MQTVQSQIACIRPAPYQMSGGRPDPIKFNSGALNHHLAAMFKIYRDARPDLGLHLSDAPIGCLPIADKIAGFQKFVHSLSPLKDRLMPLENADLTALIGSRICHDLISPIGAIGNGVELLQLEAGHTTPEMTLIGQSVANATARIRFFRVAFGEANPGQTVSQAEVQSILTDFQVGGRLTFNWNGTNDLSRQTAKLVFLMIMCLETSLPYGGTVAFDGGERSARLVGRSPRTKIDDGLWDILNDGIAPPGITASQVHFALLAAEMARQERRATVSFPTGEIVFDF